MNGSEWKRSEGKKLNCRLKAKRKGKIELCAPRREIEVERESEVKKLNSFGLSGEKRKTNLLEISSSSRGKLIE